MKKILKSLLCTTIISLTMLQSCSAFFLGSDKYTKEEYEKAGVKWEHHKIRLDNYYFNGKSISQSLAEDITTYYNKNKVAIEYFTKEMGKNFFTSLIEVLIYISSQQNPKFQAKLQADLSNFMAVYLLLTNPPYLQDKSSNEV